MRLRMVVSIAALVCGHGGSGCEVPGGLEPVAEGETEAIEWAAATHRLPLQADEDWLLARVQVGGKSVWAIYDTGLSVPALIDQDLVAELDLTLERGRVLQDWLGQAEYRRGVRLPQWSWGSWSEAQTRALVSDLSFLRTASGKPIQLVLGYGLFRDGLLQVDASAREIRLIPGSLPEPSDTNQVLRLWRWTGVPLCRLTVGEQRLRMMIDSGFNGGLALPDSYRSTLKLRNEARRLGQIRTALGSGGAIYGARLEDDLTWAGFRFPSPGVQFLEGYRHAVLGRSAFDSLVLTFDARADRMHVATPKARRMGWPWSGSGQEAGILKPRAGESDPAVPSD